MVGPSELRASDAERDHAVNLLREHATAGRLTMDELDERCTAALGATTRGELAALLHDLPVKAAPVPAPPQGRRLEARGIGVRPFTYDWRHAVSPEVATSEALHHIAPALHRQGYELVERDRRRLVFEYSYRPIWTFAVAVLLFPFGLLALLHSEEERVGREFDDAPGGGTRLVATGRAPRRVRRAFAELDLP